MMEIRNQKVPRMGTPQLEVIRALKMTKSKPISWQHWLQNIRSTMSILEMAIKFVSILPATDMTGIM